MSIASLGARMRVNRVRMVLIVAPVSVLSGWQKEAKKFLPKFAKHISIQKVHGGTAQDRIKIVRNAWKNSSFERPYVIISSWGLVASARTMATFLPPRGRSWDYVVLDEAHVIKNHTSTRFKCCFKICSRPGTHRLALTGTPFQNDVTELWSITHMTTAGNVLGKLKVFNKEYGKPIRDARCKNAGSYVTQQGQKANEKLQETLKPYLLRRRKMDFLKEELPPKREICVWVKASDQQKKMYQDKIKQSGFLVKDILSADAEVARSARTSAFQVLRQLQNLCGHPLRLLKGGDEGDIKSALEATDLSAILKGSKKLELVMHMLKGFQAEQKKTLLFSQSTQNLDVIQHVLRKQGKITYCRIDG